MKSERYVQDLPNENVTERLEDLDKWKVSKIAKIKFQPPLPTETPILTTIRG